MGPMHRCPDQTRCTVQRSAARVVCTTLAQPLKNTSGFWRALHESVLLYMVQFFFFSAHELKFTISQHHREWHHRKTGVFTYVLVCARKQCLTKYVLTARYHICIYIYEHRLDGVSNLAHACREPLPSSRKLPQVQHCRSDPRIGPVLTH